MISWIDNQGEQVQKWSIRDQITKRLPVNTREYFTKLRSGYYREFGDDEKFWLEPVNSRNTGGFTVVISKQIKPDKNTKATIVALDTNLMSLTRPAMVSGFGYRIINANGDVLFPNIKENFFAECDNNQRLRSAVTGHINDFVNVPHLGKDVRVYVTPLDGLPDWTLVVFRDKEPLRSTYSEIVALSTSLFLIYLLPLLIIMFVLALFAWKRMKWMWPSPGAAGIYLQFIPLSILFVLIAYPLSFRLSDLGLIVVLSLMSVTALLALIVSLQRNWALKRSCDLASFLERKWSKINYRTLYPLCLVALVFIIAVFPSLVFFRIAYNEEMSLFIKYGQITFVNALNERAERLRVTYPIKLFKNKNAANTFIDARSREKYDRYHLFFFDTSVCVSPTQSNPAAAGGQGTLIQELRKLLPFSNQSSIVRHGLIRDESADGRWRWGSSDANLTLQAPRVSTNGKSFLDIASTRNRYPVDARTLLFFVPVMVLVLFLLIRFILNRVFLLGTIEFPKTDIETPAPSSIRKLFLVLGSPFTRREKLLPAADFKPLNLKSVNGDGEWFKLFDPKKFLEDGSLKHIAVDCFEYQIDQPEHNLQKLDFLEKLITHDGDVLVTSTAEPTEYLFESADKNHNGMSHASARWANIMSKLWVDYREDTGDAEVFESELRTIQSGKAEAEKFYRLLIDECAPRACLQDIGIEIAKHRDFETSNPDDLIGDVLVQADTYYQLIWESCSPTEKLTLAHLAADGFLSVNDPDVPRLVRRGLIVRAREVRLMNESFRLFVLAKSRTDKEVAVSEGQARKSSSWQYLKVALSVIVIVLMVFLFATQRDLYNSTIVTLTSIAAGVPAIFNFFSLFHKNIGTPNTPARPEA